MTTKLAKPTRREIEIDGKLYTLTIDNEGLKLVEKGRRNGRELSWRDLVSGNVALGGATAGAVVGASAG